ncbi:hypothetical protein BRARA_I02807 [Brassica rapa]|uniref:Uncharacterized protein n=1 Tax=Brassica campestris TaxID=3711 RepID=A0A397XXS9_BRACM|nr:hypothetical protein BRARA_I02807 [Brassica rapa]
MYSEEDSSVTLYGEPSKRIRAPEIDISALIMENNLTLIGRVSNPIEQSIGPLISSFPRKWSLKGTVIPFWICLHKLPLHYWHEKMIYNIGQGLGVLEDYHISKTSAKIRVSVDGLQPITKTAIIEFGSGDELPVTLDYDGLENHCSHCNCLDHEVRHCPMKLSAKSTAMGSSSREEADQSCHQHSSPLLRRTSSTYEHHQHSCHGIFI